VNIKNLHLVTLGSQKSVLELEVFQRQDHSWTYRTTPDRPDVKVRIVRKDNHVYVQPIQPLAVTLLRVRGLDDIEQVRHDMLFGGDDYLNISIKMVARPLRWHQIWGAEAFLFTIVLEMMWLIMPLWEVFLIGSVMLGIVEWGRRARKPRS